MLISPQPVPTVKPVNYNLAQDTRWLEINNDSPYHLCFRFDEALLYFDYEHVDFVSKPWTSQTLNLQRPIHELSVFADADFGVAGNPTGKAPKWWFQASDIPMSSSPASYGSVGFQEQQEVIADVGPLEVSKVTNDEAPGRANVFVGKYGNDNFNRIIITNDGQIFIGNGQSNPTLLANVNAQGSPNIGPLVVTVDPTAPTQVANQRYVDLEDEAAVAVARAASVSLADQAEARSNAFTRNLEAAQGLAVAGGWEVDPGNGPIGRLTRDGFVQLEGRMIRSAGVTGRTRICNLPGDMRPTRDLFVMCQANASWACLDIRGASTDSAEPVGSVWVGARAVSSITGVNLPCITFRAAPV